MTDRQLLYRGLTFLNIVLLALIIVIKEVKGHDDSALELIIDSLALTMFLFAALWKRNLAVIIGLALNSISFNIDLFTSRIVGWGKAELIGQNLFTFVLICDALCLILFLIGLSKKTTFPFLNQDIKFKDAFLVSILLAEILTIQTLTRLLQ
jgi:hypothetical protein